MANAWFRTYAEFANDPKVQMMNEAHQRRLIMLFCFRCNGHVTLQDEEVTFQLRISPEEWQSTKAIFLARGFIDSDNNILNWDKRQYKSDSSVERVRRHRETKKQDDVTECNVTVTPQIQNRTDTEQIQKEEDLGRASSAPSAEPIKKIKSSRGTRLTRDWDLPAEWGNWAETQGMTREVVIRQCDHFKDYWIAKSGANATKMDWEATWRNWVRKHLEEYAK